jgi:hypothetical protein
MVSNYFDAGRQRRLCMPQCASRAGASMIPAKE